MSLMPTLQAWCHENGNLVADAQRLAVHRNTLTHRVQRIEALCGLRLDIHRTVWTSASPG